MFCLAALSITNIREHPIKINKMCVSEICGVIKTGKNRCNGKNTCLTASLSTINSM